jgi:hypothetical protein
MMAAFRLPPDSTVLRLSVLAIRIPWRFAAMALSLFGEMR